MHSEASPWRKGGGRPHCFRSDILSAVTPSGFAGEFQDDWLAPLSVAKDGKSWRYFGAGLFRSAPQDGRISSFPAPPLRNHSGDASNDTIGAASSLQSWKVPLLSYSLFLPAVGSDKHAPDAGRSGPPQSSSSLNRVGLLAPAPLNRRGRRWASPNDGTRLAGTQGRAAMVTRRSVSAVRRWYHALAVVLAIC